jgi:predicted dienelactone hydrolase
MDAFTAGCFAFEVLDQQAGDPIPALVIYPANAPERPERLGPYTLSVSMNAELATGPFPLIVVSHGTGSSHLLFRTLARHLARNGFVVVMPEHPRNNRNNNDLAGTAAILTNRPRHIRLVMDWAFSHDVFGPSLKPDATAIIGHSLGGYTALAAAGGVPTAFPHEMPDHQSRKVDVVPDDRVKALVLFAPAAAWFMAPGALSGVRVPILMLTAEKDPHTPAWHSEMIKQGVPDKALIEHRVIANAGHFSFLSPFPATMIDAAFAPSQDPEGFDRERFHAEMNAEVLAFLTRTLLTPAGSPR